MMTAEELKQIDDYNTLIAEAITSQNKSLMEKVVALAPDMLPIMTRYVEEQQKAVGTGDKKGDIDTDQSRETVIDLVLKSKGVVYIPGKGYVYSYQIKSGGKMFKPIFQKKSMFRKTKTRQIKIRLPKKSR